MATSESWRTGAALVESIEAHDTGETDEVRAVDPARRAEVPQAIADALSEVGVGLAVIDPDSETVVFANEALLTISGCIAAEAVGRGFTELVDDEDIASARGRLRGAAAGLASAAPLHVRVKRAHPRRVEADASFRGCERDGKRVVVAVLTPTTAREEVRALRRALDQALEALRQRDDFFALAAHELRTPLTPLLLQLQAARVSAQRDPSSLPRAMGIAEAQVKRLALLVEQLLDVARIRAGRLMLERQRIDLRVAVREAAAAFRGECARNGSTLDIQCSHPVIGRWDPLRVDQIVTNLVSNAVKYAPGAPIRISLTADERCATITVRDHGTGIAPQHLVRVFERFERANDGSVRGTGLGLWIVRQLVEAHGGTIDVASEPGCGATFVVELPFE